MKAVVFDMDGEGGFPELQLTGDFCITTLHGPIAKLSLGKEKGATPFVWCEILDGGHPMWTIRELLAIDSFTKVVVYLDVQLCQNGQGTERQYEGTDKLFHNAIVVFTEF